jgi:hypothetical protein
MRRLAQGLFGLATDIMAVIVVIMVGAIGAAIGFVIGLSIFGSILGLGGWFLAGPALIIAAVGFAVGAGGSRRPSTTWETRSADES